MYVLNHVLDRIVCVYYVWHLQAKTEILAKEDREPRPDGKDRTTMEPGGTGLPLNEARSWPEL
jgi:hypothetical protein